jgi:exopolyphosphatase / guanosine-5'-triphosphate,3'-diphosphate pyrophosphatase
VISHAIVPRWEWRAFGDHFGGAEDRFDAVSPERVEDSDELYVLSQHSDASVKVRGGLLDVKRLERISDDGLQQWLPVMKVAFPLAAAEARSVFAALGAVAPSLARTAYTLEQLLEELVGPSPDLLAVRVQKRREHYTIGGCMAERTEIRTDREGTRTIAVESEDSPRVTNAVRELGLGSYPNVNVPRGLKALVGFGARRYAVIDIGTNSVKLHIGDRGRDGTWRTVVDRAEITRLGEGLADTGRLDAMASERTIEAISRMVDEARRSGVVAIAAVGTAGLRRATNSEAFTDAVQERCGLQIDVVSGEEESRLGYLGAASGLALDERALLVFDAGGGSTEFTFGRGRQIDERFSLDVGAVALTERYGLGGVASEHILTTALDAVAADLVRLHGRPAPDLVVAIGGSATNLAAVKHKLATYDPDVVQGTVLDRGEIDRQIELYRSRTAEQRRQIVGLQPERADIILAGACIVRTVLAALGLEALTVSDRGLRHGLLVDRYGL